MSSVSDLEEEDVGEPPVASAASAGGRGSGMGDMAKSTHASKGKRLSEERIYQKMSQLEHVLLRPDTYVGSVEPVTQNMWVYDPEDGGGGGGMKHRSVTFVPGLYKIFDEIQVNVSDNKQRDKNMDCIKV
ncbi:hypothetical protein MRX96_008461 [Rhipicephalus microplus]